MEAQTRTAKVGRYIFHIRIISQGLSYVVYDLLIVTAHRSSHRKADRLSEPQLEQWRRVLIVLGTITTFPFRNASMNVFIHVVYSVHLSRGRDGARSPIVLRCTRT